MVRHESDVSRWQMIVREPAPVLRTHVRRYSGYAETTGHSGPTRELPNGGAVFIVNLGEPLRVSYADDPARSEALEGAFVAGLHDCYVTTEVAGQSRGVQIDLTPLGAWQFLGRPLGLIANCAVPLDALIGPEGRVLTERLRDAPSWDARFDIIDEAIAQRFAASPPVSEGIAWAWSRIDRSGGSVAIGSLCETLGYSRKHLVAQFREHVGMTPKTLARIVRFRRVIRMLERVPQVNWAAIAAACGYYDQAHLIRDFRQFAGSTPSAFVRRRVEPT
jgi:AraC-like DNA-binding protein